MQLSKNILRGMLLGISTISLGGIALEAAAQKTSKVPEQVTQPKDTTRINCAKPNPGAYTNDQPKNNERPRVVRAANDSTDLIYKEPCITCGRG